MKKRILTAVLTALLLLIFSSAALGEADWDELMRRMDWSTPACGYAMDGVTVSRTGSDVHISGGEIAGVVRLVVTDQWEDYQTAHGWHTPSGSYTFSNVAFHDDMYIWAHTGESYRVTLKDSVSLHENFLIICEAYQGADVEIISDITLSNRNDFPLLLYAQGTSTIRVTGKGRILRGVDLPKDMDYDPEASFVACMGVSAPDNGEAIRALRATRGQISVDYDMVKVDGGYPAVADACYYSPYPDEPYYSEDILHPGTQERYALPPAFFITGGPEYSFDGVITLPEDLSRIESQTFAGVTAQEIIIPASVTYIAEDAFAGSRIVEIHGSSDVAKEYAMTYGFTYTPVK